MPNLTLLGLILRREMPFVTAATATDVPKPARQATQEVVPVLRGRAFELVDERGQVRSRLKVESDGEVVLRLVDRNGTNRVELGASESGSGLLLLDGATEPGVHIVARRGGTAANPTTTSLTLHGASGQQRVITPSRVRGHAAATASS